MSKIKLSSLRKFNLTMAGLHAVQAGAILALSNTFTLPVTIPYLDAVFNIKAEAANQMPTLVTRYHTLGQVRLGWLVAGFLALSALAHLIIATVYRKRYESDLQKGMNKARWIEYSLSASTMMVAIAMLVGIYDFGSLVMVFALTAGMNLMGLVMEIHNQTTKKTNWLSYVIGCLLGAVPWFVVGAYFWSTGTFGSGQIPTFVYWIYVSIFAFFNCFAINMILQYAKVGKWSDYLFGEKSYIVLSLVAKSLLAWQVFAGTLRPN
jgi:hypothetical protein